MKDFWDEWRGSHDGNKVMLIKTLFELLGMRFDLHCFCGSDEPDCFHTHPRWAFRFVIWGGYIEEMESGERKLWFPLRFGLVSPDHSHRVVTPIYRNSYSLWIRFPTMKHKVELRGKGWP